MKKLIVIIFVLSYISGKSQQSFDSLRPTSGLANLLISGPFDCPSPKQPIRFPKQFYKENGKPQILEIYADNIKREVPCISSKKDFSYYNESSHYCGWWFAMKYIPTQCNKWKKAGENGVSPAFRTKFYKKLTKTKSPHSFLIPDLSMHYFYFDRDTFPDLAVYDCTNGVGAQTSFMRVVKDSVDFLREIYGYAHDIRRVKNGLVVLTSWEGTKEGDYHAQAVYNLIHTDKGVMVYDSLVIASEKGMKVPNYSMDKKFRMSENAWLLGDASKETGMDELYPKGSFGYVLAEEGNSCFVIMINNLPTEKNTFRSAVEIRMGKKIGKFYTMGWMDKESISYQ